MSPNIDIEKIRVLKKNWIEITLWLAILLPTIAGLSIKDWSLYTDALSDFGTHPGTAGIWSVFLVIVAIGLWLNGTIQIDEVYIKDKKKSYILFCILTTACIGLFLTALVTNEFHLPHGIVVAVFFLAYALFIFMFGFWQISTSLKNGAFSIISAFTLILTTLLVIPYSGLAMFEIAYISLIIFWNWALLKKWPVDKITNIF